MSVPIPPLARYSVLASVLALAGCREIPEAPTELSELSTYLYRHFDHEDPVYLCMGMDNLRTFFADVDMDRDWQDLSYEVEQLDQDDVAGIERPEDRSLEDTLPVALVTDSAFTPDQHADVIILEDQTPVEPAAPELYDRIFVDPADPACFPDRGCTVIRALNDIHRENLVVDLRMVTNKDYRWVELGEPGSGEWGALSRSWLPESSIGDAGAVALYQAYTIDLFLPVDGGAIRYMAIWSETVITGVNDETLEYTCRLGLHQIFDATEEYLEETER
ncbi:MAG: hypothetical protein QGH45_08140 [Myxococcota bacterium]|nr:hypothetical protein [Myxococcota bacterium]